MRTKQRLLYAQRPMMALWVCVLSLACVVACPRPARADGRWLHFRAPEEPDPNKGLLSNQVRALAYERGEEPGTSRLWVGTDTGLQTYNGRNWQDHSSPAKGVDNGSVKALAVGAQGTLWVGTELGLNRRSAEGEWEAVDSLAVLSLATDDRGGVYAGTQGNGVWYCTGTGCERIADQASQILPSDFVPALLYTDEGALWIGTEAGLVRRRSEGEQEIWTPHEAFAELPSDMITALAMDGQGRLWVGTNAGVTRYDVDQDEWVSSPLGHVHSLAIDSRDRVWAARNDALLKRDPRWEGQEAELAAIPEELPRMLSQQDEPLKDREPPPLYWRPVRMAMENPEGINRVFVAPDDVLWVGTQDGLHGLDGSWETYTSQELARNPDAPQVRVESLLRDPDTGELWSGTDIGILHYDPATDLWDHVWMAAEGRIGNRVLALAREEGSDVLWVATDGGVARYNLRGYVENAWTVENALAGNTVYALVQGGKGDLWAGGIGGVSHYDAQKGRWDRTWTTADGLGKVVYALALDERVDRFDLWAGTEAGLYHYASQADRWRQVSLTEGLGRGLVRTMALDTDRNELWVGIEGQVQRYNVSRKEWDSPWLAEGSSETGQVSALAWDRETGQVWAGTDKGVSRYSPATERWDHTWTAKDGLASDGVLALAHGLKNDELWVGTDGGISHFAVPERPMPWVRLTLALSGGKDLLPEGKVTLYGSQTVQFQFEGGSFAAQRDELRYSYRLQRDHKEGSWTDLEEQKVDITRDDLQFFTDYTFELRVQDHNGRVSMAQTRFPLAASPLPFRIGLPREGGYLVWGGVFGGLLIGLSLAYALRNYPSYAVSWGAASGQPLEQLIPLVAPLNQPLDVPRVQAALHKREAFPTPQQVQDALQELVRDRMLIHAEGGGYRFISPLAAWLHRLQNLRRVDALAEAVRSRHPFHAGARTFFTQADFKVVELSPETLLLVPGKSHPQATYGTIYARIIAGRSPEGDDFEAVADEAKAHYGDEVEHRLAFVVTNRRPTPGARYRLYEIRQRWGLAIVVLDSELFGQVKPNMPASNILAAQIDQATGRQNLYAISGPVSDDLSFFGRETALQQLIDLVEAGQPVGIFGLRKTGKTSLTQRLQGRLATRRVIASVDTQGTARVQGVSPLYPTIIGAFVTHIERYRAGLSRTMPPLNLWPPPKQVPSLSDVVNAFATDLAALYQHIGGDERLLLILDEVDRLLPAGDDGGYEGFSTFLGQLRAANQGLKLLDFILVGVDPSVNRRDRWQDRDNELYQSLREVWMPAMDTEAASEMVESIGLQMGIQYRSQALERIVQAGGGQPFVTRQICSQVIKDAFDRAPATIDEGQAQLGIEEFVYMPESYLTELWRARLDAAQRAVLLRLARSDDPVPRMDLLPTDQRQDMLATLGALQESTLIRRQAKGYVIGWGVLRDWIRWIELGLE